MNYNDPFQKYSTYWYTDQKYYPKFRSEMGLYDIGYTIFLVWIPNEATVENDRLTSFRSDFKSGIYDRTDKNHF